jgi:hypothetical protein
MQVIEEPLRDKRQTVNRIFELSRRFSGDLDRVFVRINGGDYPAASLTLAEYFDFVKSIPYRRDREPVEIVARPRIIFTNYLSGIGKDCKKSAVLVGAYLEKKHVPWRLAVISTRRDREMHHIFPQADVYFSGDFLNIDATYSNMHLFSPKNVTAVEYYVPGTGDIVR